MSPRCPAPRCPAPRQATPRDITIVKLVAGGDGLAFAEGKAVFVSGVLPGERVRARIIESRRDFERAEILEILEPSADRCVPACRLAGICGGCNWLHIRYEAQVELKREIVREALRRIGGMETAGPALTQDPAQEPGLPLGYRNRVQIHASPSGLLGFKSARSSSVVPVDSCPVAVSALNGIFQGRLPAPASLSRFTAFSNGTWVACEGIDDERELTVPVHGREISFSVGCFFQGNLAALDALAGHAVADLDGRTAADLYCGVGTFGALVRDRFEKIIAVESSPLSVGYARRNIGGDDIYPMSVEQWIGVGGAREPLDAVIVDPPRAGLAAEVRAFLCRAKPSRLVYVSCDPVTLARDLRGLVSEGFTLEDLALFDFFPQTSHVESVATLRFRA